MQGHGKVALIIGASRGIGRQVAVDLAAAGYKVIISGKSTSSSTSLSPNTTPDPNSPSSTITTVAHEITQQGHTAHAIPADARDPDSLTSMINQAGAIYGRIDVLIYNAGAIWWASVANTPLKRFRLMQQVNVEGLYASVQAALPWFEKGGWQGRVIVVSPPVYSRFFRGKTAYAMGKVGMSVLTKGLAMDWHREGKTGMAITSIWPASAIQSGATRDVGDLSDLRHASIYSDAILAMLSAPVSRVNGLLDTDEDFLRSFQGITDFSKYALVPGTTPRRIMPKEFPDLTVAEQDDEGKRMDSAKQRRDSKL